MSVTDYSKTASSNTTIDSTDISEGCSPAGINNAIRSVMKDIAEVVDGTTAMTAFAVDNLKMDGNTLSSTDTNGDIVLDPNGTGSVDLDGAELILDADGDTSITADTDDRIDFKTAGTDRMRIDSSGNLLINTTSTVDNAKLHVVQSGNRAGIAITGSSVGGSAHIRNETDQNTMTAHVFRTNTSTQAGYISCSGSTTSYVTSSDYRLKENVEDMTGAITRVKSLKPKRFSWIADDENSANVDGFLAHEAQTVVPEAVGGTHNEVDDDNNPVMQGIDQSKLVPLLTGALQEAITKIETLETEMTALKARVTTLENA